MNITEKQRRIIISGLTDLCLRTFDCICIAEDENNERSINHHAELLRGEFETLMHVMDGQSFSYMYDEHFIVKDDCLKLKEIRFYLDKE